MPSARGARAKLLERKLATRRRESEAEFESARCVVAISSGKLSAKAKHIKPSTTQEGEVFRMETLVLGER